MIHTLLALALVPTAPVQAAAAPQCAVGLWQLSGYQQKAVSTVYDTSLLVKGATGARMKITAKGSFTYDFKGSAKVVTKGRTNSVPIAETALYRRVLKHAAGFKGRAFATKISSATGTALVKTVSARPRKASRLEKVARLVRTEGVTIVPTGKVAFACTDATLHFRKTVKLDSQGGRTVTDWWFRR